MHSSPVPVRRMVSQPKPSNGQRQARTVQWSSSTMLGGDTNFSNCLEHGSDDDEEGANYDIATLSIRDYWDEQNLNSEDEYSDEDF